MVFAPLLILAVIAWGVVKILKPYSSGGQIREVKLTSESSTSDCFEGDDNSDGFFDYVHGGLDASGNGGRCGEHH